MKPKPNNDNDIFLEDLEDAEYRSTDLGFASTLYSLGYDIKRLDYSNRSKEEYYFVIDIDKRKGESLEGKYWNSKLQVDALKIVQAIKIIKSRLYGNKK